MKEKQAFTGRKKPKEKKKTNSDLMPLDFTTDRWCQDASFTGIE